MLGTDSARGGPFPAGTPRVKLPVPPRAWRCADPPVFDTFNSECDKNLRFESRMSTPAKPAVSPAELAQLEHAFATEPNSDAYRPLAEAYLSLGRFMEAMVVCKKGVKSHPEAVGGRVLLARVYADQGKDKKALEELAGALQVGPNDVPALKLAGHLALKNGEEAGREHLKKALALAPNDAELVDLCGKWGIAPPAPPPPPPGPAAAPGPVTSLHEREPLAAEMDVPPPPRPGHRPAPVFTSGAANAPTQPVQAVSPAARPRARGDGTAAPVQRPPPRRQPSYDELASRYGERDEDVSRAPGGHTGQFVTIAIAVFGALSLAGYFGFTKWKADRDRKVSKLLKDAQEQIAHDAFDGYKQACEAAEKVLDLDPNSLGAHAYLAYAYAIRWGEHGEGEKAAAQSREHIDAAKRLGQEHGHLEAAERLVRFFGGETQAAQTDLEKFIADLREKGRQPTGLLLTALGKIQMFNGDLEKAIENLKEAQQRDPTSARVFSALGNAFRRLGDEFEAANAYESALRYEASHAEACVGVALLALPDPQKREVAQRYAERVLKSDPPASPRQIALASMVKATLLLQEGKKDEARRSEDAAMALDPHNGELFILRAQTLLREGQPGLAILEAKKAVQLDSRRASFHLDLGRALLAQPAGCKEAIVELGKAQMAVPGNDKVTLLLGESYEKCADLEGALRQYGKAAGDDKKRAPEARRRIAAIYRAQKQHKKAAEIYERAVTDATGKARLQSDILVELGRMQEDQNDLNTAQKTFRRSVTADDRNPEAYYWWGRLYALDRDPKVRVEARDLFEKYLEYAPVGTRADEVKKMLAALPADKGKGGK